MSRSVILTGLRANNDLHIGNYLGALLPLIDMAKKRSDTYQINLFVPDLHSFTTPIVHEELQKRIMNNLRVFVAAGLPLEHNYIHIYRQSYISAHSELTWILDCFTGFGEMSRMTQFKDKSQRLGDNRISVGLFNYPVLMAADILLYNAKFVPVGDDQSQHLEYARNIAERMNKQFGQLFTVPESVDAQHKFFNKDQGIRIRDLLDPTKKMSKSDETGKGVIFLADSPNVARTKIMSATTDSHAMIRHNYESSPGISNLLDIYKLFGGDPKSFVGQSRYGDLKNAVANTVADFLSRFQADLDKIDDDSIVRKLEASEEAMNVQANKVLLAVQKAVGLRK